jgi:hypothetical protein
MGWLGHGIYDGDETQTLHYYFIKWAKIEKNDDIIESFLNKKTILPADKVYLLKKNSSLILKKMKKPKFWDEDSAIEWHMLLSLYSDNNVIPPKTILNNGIEATEYLIDKESYYYNDPSARKRVLRNFIQKVKKMVKNN